MSHFLYLSKNWESLFSHPLSLQNFCRSERALGLKYLHGPQHGKQGSHIIFFNVLHLIFLSRIVRRIFEHSTNDLPSPPWFLLSSSLSHLSHASHFCHHSDSNLLIVSTFSSIIQSADVLNSSKSGHCPMALQSVHARIRISKGNDRGFSGRNLTPGGTKTAGVLEQCRRGVEGKNDSPKSVRKIQKGSRRV